MQIIFEPDATYDFETGNLVFFCTADGEPVRCAITEEALIMGLNVPREEVPLPETFSKYRDKIHAVATRLVQKEGWNELAGVLITHSEVLEHDQRQSEQS